MAAEFEFPPKGIAAGVWTKDTTDAVVGIGGITYYKYKTTLAGAAYGVGQYVAWTNDYFSGGGEDWNPAGAFNKVSGSTASQGWASAASYSTTVDQVTPSYVALSLPERIKLVRYTVQCRSDAATQAPTAWILSSSSDGGVTFQELHRISGQTGWTIGETRAFSVADAPADANTFKVAPLRGTSAGAVSIGEIAFIAAPVTVLEYPPAGIATGGAWTRDTSDVVPGIALGSSTYAKYKTTLAGAAYGNGQYIAWSNNIYSVGGTDEYPASGAFDRQLSATNGKSGWHVNTSLYSNVADAAEPPYVALALPERIQLSRYVVQARNASLASTQTPSAWILYWSSDGGATFQELQRIKGQTGWDAGEERTFSIANAPAEANAFKLAVLRNNSPTPYAVCIGNIAFFGTPLAEGVRFPPLGYAPAGSAWTKDASASVASRSTGAVTNYKYSAVMGSSLAGTPVAAVVDVGPNAASFRIGSTSIVGSSVMRAFPSQDPFDGSLYLDGTTGCYVAVPSTSAAFVTDWSAQDFTAEAWINLPSVPTVEYLFGNYDYFSATPHDSWHVGVGTDLKPLFYYWNGTTQPVKSSVAIALNTWNHVAVCYTLSTLSIKVFVNGVLTASGTKTGTANLAATNFTVGAYGYSNSGVRCYISNLRVVKSAALYTANFVPPRSPLIKTTVSGTTALLLRTPLIPPGYALPVDKGAYNVPLTVAGTGVVNSATMSPFASDATEGSMYFSGASGAYLTLPSTSSAFVSNWSTTAFLTVEAWIYLPAVPTNPTLFGNYDYFLTSPKHSWSVMVGADLKPRFYYWNGAEQYLVSSTAVVLGTWNHVAVTYTQSTAAIVLYLNGANVATGTKTGTPDTAAVGFTVGANSASASFFMSNLRITTSATACVYTAAFTPSTAPLTAVTGTVLLLKCPVVAPYGAGTYRTWSNTLAVGKEPAAAFDGRMTPWISEETAAYSAGADVTGTPGELALSLPAAVRATSYTLTPPALSSDVTKMPTKWTLLGSADSGTSFPYTIDTLSNSGPWTAGQPRTFAIDSTATVCNAYKWQFYRNGSASATGLSLVQAAVFGVPSSAADASPVPYPPLRNGPVWVRDDLDTASGVAQKYKGTVTEASYGNGSYAVYASSESATLGPASWALDARDGASSWTPGPSASYTSYIDTPNPDTLTLILPYRVKPASYVLRSRVDDVPETAPSKWTFAASTDGGRIFVTLDTRTDLAAWAAGERRTYAVSNPSGKDYNAVRWTFYRNNRGGAVISFPTANLTGDEGLATASSTVIANSEPYLAFSTGGDADGWSTPAGLYTATTGAYVGTTAASGSYIGEWLQIRFLKPVMPSTYRITVNTVARGPKAFALLGSNDGGLTWSLLDAQTSAAAYTSGAAAMFTVSQATPTAFYLYRLVVSATQGDTTLSVCNLVIRGQVSMLCVADARLYAPALASAPSTSMASSAAVLEGVPGCVGWYRGDTWSGSQWRDASGAGNHLTTVKGTIGTSTDPLKGFKYVRGGTDSSVTLSPAILQATPAYTIFHVAKYDGLSRKRILTSTGPTGGTRNAGWYSGFWAGHAGGVSYQGADAGWVAPPPGGVSGPQLFSFPPSPLTAATTTLSSTTYPNAAMAAALNGVYTVTASSEYTGGWYAFDATIDTPWTATLTSYNTAGVYAGTATRTLSDGSTYNGEWVQLQAPGAVVPHAYLIRIGTPRLARYPTAFVFLGSNDGATWTVLDKQTAASGWSATANDVSFTLPEGQAVAYKYFSFSFNAKVANADVWFSIDNLTITASLMPSSDTVNTTIHGADEWIVSTDQKGSYRSNGAARVKMYGAAYPPVSAQSLITSNTVTIANQLYGNGTWTISSSSQFPGYNLWYVLNTSTADHGWYANGPSYSSTDSTYLGILGVKASTVAADASTTYGEWLQVALPSAIVLKSYMMQPRVQAGTFYAKQSPRNFVVFGSKTGAAGTWVAVDTRTGINDWTALPRTFTVSPATSEAYPFYRVAVTVIGNTSTAGAGEYLSLAKLTLYETEAAQPGMPYLFAYPPVAAQSSFTSNAVTISNQPYGNGAWAISSSSSLSGYAPYQAFDNVTSGYNGWFTDQTNAATLYTSATGVYSGTTTFLASGTTSYVGEWLQVTLPAAIVLNSYSILPCQDTATYVLYAMRSPRIFTMLGSNTGTDGSWTVLDSHTTAAATAVADWTLAAKTFTISPSTQTAYSYYRLTVQAIGNTGQTNYMSAVMIASMALYGASPSGVPFPSATAQTLITSNQPTAALTGLAYGNGFYTLSASSEAAVGNEAWRAFNPTTSTNKWAATGYTAATGVYAGATSTTLADGVTSFAGEWLQASFPVPFFLQSYTLTPDADLAKTPRSFALLGSADGVAWYTLDSTTTDVGDWLASSAKPAIVPSVGTSPVAYSYYRLVIRAVGNTGQTSGRDTANVKSLVLNGVPTANASITPTLAASQPKGGQYPSTAVQTLVTSNAVTVANKSYGNGAYAFSASTFASYDAYMAFNTSVADYWHSVNSVYTSGTYNSNKVTTLADGTTKSGEWIQIQVPTPIVIASYTIMGRQDSSLYASRSPRDFVLLGSNDGTAWYTVDSRTAVNAWTAAASVFTVPGSVAFSYYRLSVQTVGNSGVTVNTDSVNLASFFLTEACKLSIVTAPYPSPAIQALATANSITVTGQTYGNGTWAFSAGSSDPAGPVYNAFNNVVANGWYSLWGSSTYSSRVNNFTTTLANGTTKNGDYVQVQMPSPITVVSYTIVGRQDQTLYASRSPSTFVLLGSTDGSAWKLLDSRTSVNDWTADPKTFTLDPRPTADYAYYRIVVQAVGNTGVTQNVDSVNISTLYFTGGTTTTPFPSAAIRTLLTTNTATISNQAYGNGTWIVSASSIYYFATAPTYDVNNAFNDKVVNSYPSYWVSDTTTTTTYQGTTGEYNTQATRAFTKTFDGAVYYGEWLQVQLPSPVFPQAYTITPRQDGSCYTYRSPRNFVVLGSSDGVNWVLLDARTGYNTSWTAAAKTFEIAGAASPMAVPYSYFRLVTQAVNTNGNNHSTCVNIVLFEIDALPISSSTLAPTTTSYPLSINGFSTEASDWALAEMLVFGRHLSGPEVLLVEDYLTRRYVGTASTAATTNTSTAVVPAASVSFASIAASLGVTGPPYRMSIIRSKLSAATSRSTSSSTPTVPLTGKFSVSNVQTAAGAVSSSSDPVSFRLDASFLNRGWAMAPGATVSTWYDTLHTRNAVGYGAPKLRQADASRGGYWYVEFQRASNQYFTLGGDGPLTLRFSDGNGGKINGVTIMAVVAFEGAGASERVFDFSSSTADTIVMARNATADSLIMQVRNGAATNGSFYTSPGTVVTEAGMLQLLVMVYDNVNNTMTAYCDGTKSTSVSADMAAIASGLTDRSLTTSTCYIGSVVSSGFFQGRMAELAFYPAVLAADRFAQESAALFAKYGRGMIRRTNLALHLDPTLPPQAVEFPPGPMTAASTTFGDGYTYGAGAYVATASTTYADAVTNLYFPFDKVTTPATANSWSCSSAAYTTATGLYKGGTYTTAIDGGSGGVVAGEWLQLQLPQPIALTYFVLHAINATNYLRTPQNITILGSNNGSRWSRVGQEVTGLSYTSAAQGQTVTVNCAARYRFYRFVVTAVQAGVADGFLSIGELRLFGDPSPVDSPVLVAPLADLSGNGVSITPVGAARVVAPSGTNSSWLFTDYGWLATSLKTALVGNSLFSYEAWFYYPKGALLSSTGPSGSTALVSNSGSPALPATYWMSGMHVDAAGFLRAFDGDQVAYRASAAFPQDQWVHAVMACSATTITLYVDGVLAGTGSRVGAGGISGGQGFHIGGGTGGRGMAIALGPVRIYTGTTLSAQDVSRHYNAEKARVCTARASIPALVGDALHLDAQHAVPQSSALLPITASPKIWLRLEELSSLVDGVSNAVPSVAVASWPSAVGTAVATGVAGTGSGSTLPMMQRPPATGGQPYVRLGTGFSSPGAGNYFSLGKQTFNLATAGGFTAVCLVRFRASPTAAETLFDFGSSVTGTDTLALTRSDLGKAGIVVRNSSLAEVNLSLAADVISDWAVLAMRVSSTATSFWAADGTLTSTTTAATLTDRTLTGCFVGRSWASNAFASMDVREMLFFEGALSDGDVGLLRGYLAAKFVQLPPTPLTPALAPRIWLRMDELSSLAHGATVNTWSSAVGTTVAIGGANGTGTTLPIINKASESFPFIRFGTGIASMDNGSYFNCGASTWDQAVTGGFTAVCAVRYRSPSTGYPTYERIFDFGWGTGPNGNMMIYRSGGTSILHTVYTGGSSAGSSSGTITPGAWHIVAARFGASDTTMWVDGTKVSVALTITGNVSRPFTYTYIGGKGYTTEYNANIDVRELMFFDGYLSDNEVGMARAYMNTKFGAPIALTKPVASAPILTPKIWLRMEELYALTHGASVASWASAVGNAAAAGAKAGTGALPVVNRTLEGYPFVRMGTDTNSAANGGYFDCGAQTFNMLAAGGFTAVCAIRLRSIGAYERVFDFGSGAPLDTIMLYRHDTSTEFGQTVINGTTAISAVSPLTGATITSGWQVVALRVTAAEVAFFGDGGKKVTTAPSAAPLNRSVLHTYIGKTHWGDAYANMDVRELMFFDGALSDFEIATLRAKLAAKFATSLPASSLPAAPTATTPKLWLRMEDLAALPHGASVNAWASAVGNAAASGYAVGTGTKPAVVRTLEAYPFVRMGTGASSTANGGYFDFGAQTFNMATNGGFTAVMAVRMPTVVNGSRFFDFASGYPINNIIAWAAVTSYGFTAYNGTSFPANAVTTVGISTSTWQVVAIRMTSTDSSFFSDTGAKTTYAQLFAMTDRTLSGTYIGKSWDPASPLANLDVRELMFFDGALSDAEISSLQGKLAAKFATPAALPATPTAPVAAPKIWLRMDELAGLANGTSVATWASAVGSAVATGYLAGGGTKPAINRTLESQPFVRMGSGASSTTDGGYFDLGSQTWNMATNGGFTVVMAVRMPTFINATRFFDFGSGNPSNNILAYAGASVYAYGVYSAAAVASNDVSAVSVSATAWQVVAIRVTSTDSCFFSDTGVKTTQATTYPMTDRTLTNCYIGKSWWTDPYTNLDVREMMFFDGALSDVEIDRCRMYMIAKYAPVVAPSAGPSSGGRGLPKIWLRMDELSSMTHGASVVTWPSATGSATALGYKAGTGTGYIPKIDATSEPYPFVRMGTDTNSTVDGGYFDLGSQTFKAGTNGGATVVCMIRLRGAKAQWERVYDFDTNMVLSRDTLTTSFSASANWAITGGWQVTVVRWAGTEQAIFKDDGTKVTAVMTAKTDLTFAKCWIGRSINGDSYANLDVREMMFFDGALTDAEVSQARGYLLAKYAIAPLTMVPSLPAARMPKLWLRMEELSAVADNTAVSTWAGALGTPSATGYNVGTGTVKVNRSEASSPPFVRMGTGVATTANGGYLNFGSQTFNMLTNGGFTAIMAVRMPTVISGSRFFDFGSGGPNNNILSWASTSTYGYFVYAGTTTPTTSVSSVAISTSVWQIVAIRLTPTDSCFYSDTGVKSTQTTYIMTDRTLSSTYIGKSWNGDSYATLDVREMMFFDCALTDNEIEMLRVSLAVKFAASLPNTVVSSTWPDRNAALTLTPSLPAARPPKLWLRMDDLGALVHGASVASWPCANSSAVAMGYKAGTGTVPVVNRTLEGYPFVRMGTDAASTTSGGYFDFGSQTFNVASNGGFTAVCAVRMRGVVSSWERVFDFGSGASLDTINLVRNGTNTYLIPSILNGGTYIFSNSLGNLATISGGWQTVAIRFTANDAAFVTDAGIKLTGTITTAPVNRTVTNTLIGKSFNNADGYANLDIRELMFFDGALSDNDIQMIRGALTAKFASSSTAPATWQDRSGNSNDLALTSCSLGTSGIKFDGATSFGYRSALSGFSSKDAYTLVAWVQTADLAGSLIGMNRTPANSAAAFAWNVNGFADASTSSGFLDKPTNAISTSQWCMLAFVKERSTGRFYLDGVRSSADLSAAMNVSFSAANLCIGKDYRDGARFFNGTMGLLAVFNRALTDAELTALHELYRGRFTPAYNTIEPTLLATSTAAASTSSMAATVNLPSLLMPTTGQTSGPTVWSFVGAPPAGVSLNRATGDVTVAKGANVVNTTLTVTATNSAGTATRAVTLNPAFPPTTLTNNSTTVAGAAYGNGAYVASASTTLTNYSAFNAFGAGSSSTGWSQAAGTYTGTAFAYGTGVAATATLIGGSYVGEWLQLKMPQPIQLTSYTVAAKTATTAPQDWVLLGSNDGGTTWTLIDTRTAVTGYNTTTPKTFAVSIVNALYSTFRMVVSKSTSASLAVYDLRFYGSPPGTLINGGPTFDLGAYNMSPWSGSLGAFPDTAARWIWTSASADTVGLAGTVTMYAYYNNATSAAISATFRMHCDNYAILKLNGTTVLNGTSVEWMTRSDVAVTLQPGTNVFQVDATNIAAGPSGFIASLVASGTVLLRTNASTWINGIYQPSVYPNAAAIRTANPSATDGDYWIQPPGQTTPLLCYVNFTNATAGKGWVLVQRGRESLDYWAAAGQNTGTGLTVNNLGVNTPVANAPSAWVNALTGSWSGTRMLLNRPLSGDSYTYRGVTTGQQFAWSLFNTGTGTGGASTVAADVARYAAMWASGTAQTAGTCANTIWWVDTNQMASNIAANDVTRSFSWTWASHGGYQGWSVGNVHLAGGYEAANEANSITRANVYVEC